MNCMLFLNASRMEKMTKLNMFRLRLVFKSNCKVNKVVKYFLKEKAGSRKPIYFQATMAGFTIKLKFS